MKLSATTLTLTILLAAMPAAGQRHKISEINAETEEGKILQAIATEESAGRKQAMMDHFVERWPKHEAFGWVLSQLQQTQLKAGAFDKAMETGTKLIALDPADVNAAYAGLKAAEGKKDSAAILKWGVATSEAAKKAIAEPKGAEESAEDHASAATQAKQSAVYAEYALSATALGSTDAAMVIQFTEALEKQNVKSQYFPPLLAKYAWAARQANAIPAAVEFGERVMAADALNEDLLLIMADYYMNQKKDPDRVLACTTKLVDYMSARQKPEGISDADWEKKKNTSLGLAYWMQGATYAGQNKHPQTDKAFRAALPLIKENEALTGPALFYLGLANYQMGKGTKGSPQTLEAVKFMQQASAVKGPFQVKAQANVTAMKKEAGHPVTFLAGMFLWMSAVTGAQVDEITRSALLIDSHNDTTMKVLDGYDIASPRPNGSTDLAKLRAGNAGAVFFAAYVPAKYAKSGGSAAYCRRAINAIRNDIVAKHPADFVLARTAAEIEAARKQGKIAALIGIEGGHAIEDSLVKLKEFFDLGARYMTLTHTNTNGWADSSGDKPKHHGLNDLGRQVVGEMNRLGMIVDISHVSDETFRAVLEVSKAPVFASHSSCRAISQAKRNMTDDMLRALGAKGGVVQINFACGFLNERVRKEQNGAKNALWKKYGDDIDGLRAEAERRFERATLDDVVAHIDHAVKMAGIDHVGIGSDYDGIDCAPKGLDDYSKFPALTRALLEKGYTADQIRKIYGGNTLRLMREVERVAATR